MGDQERRLVSEIPKSLQVTAVTEFDLTRIRRLTALRYRGKNSSQDISLLERR